MAPVATARNRHPASVYSFSVGKPQWNGRDGATQGNGVQVAPPPRMNYHSRDCRVASPPSEFRRILIIGAGGFGREALNWARDAWPDCIDSIAGYLSADPVASANGENSLPIIGDPESFNPLPGDGLLLAIGIPGVRRRVAEALLARGATFLTLVHPTAVVAPTATLGAGSILCPHAVVSDSARLGRFTLVNYHASVAHDATTGDFVVLSPSAALAGGATVADDVFLGLNASVGPAVAVGPRSKVAANSCALRDVPADSLVLGVPGATSPLLS